MNVLISVEHALKRWVCHRTYGFSSDRERGIGYGPKLRFLAWVIMAAGFLVGACVPAFAAAEFSEEFTVYSKQFDTQECLSIADIDGDGDQDVVSATSWGYVYWHENVKGDGSSWKTHQVYQGSGRITAIVTRDIDRDRSPDIFIAMPEGDSAYWIRNEDKGRSWQPMAVAAEEGQFSALSMADVDGDGDEDVVVASVKKRAVSWLENNGASPPSFIVHPIHAPSAGVDAIYAADVDGDGDPDVVAGLQDGDKIVWFENVDGKGKQWRFKPVDTAEAQAPRSVFVADMDGDKDMDVVAALYTVEKIVWYENVGGQGAKWQAKVIAQGEQSGGPTSVFVVDIDSDGDPDVLGAGWLKDDIWWYENVDGKGGSWSGHLLFDGGSQGASTVLAADLDGEGSLDALSAHAWSWGFSPVFWFKNVTEQADLKLALTGSPSPITAGGREKLTYKITVQNSGPTEPEDVTLKGTMPADLREPEVSLDGGANWNPWKGALALGPIAASATKTVEIRGSVGSSTSADLVSSVRGFSSDRVDPRTADNTAVFKTEVNVLSDLSITKSGPLEPVTAGEKISYTITVSNAGPSDAAEVQVEDLLTSEFRSPEYSIDGGLNWQKWNGVQELGSIPSGDSKEIQLRATLASSVKNYVASTAKVRSKTKEINAANNSSGRLEAEVSTRADVSLDASISPEELMAGREVTYSFALKNQGPSDAQGVVFKVNPAPQLADLRFSLSGGNDWKPWQGTLNFEKIRARSSKTALLRGQLDPSAEIPIDISAELSSDTTDPNVQNNRFELKSPVRTLADLKVSQEESRQVAVAGEMFTFSVYVNNNGPSSAKETALSGTITTDLSSLSVSLDDGTSWTELQETLNLGLIPSGERRRILIRGSLAASASEEVSSSWEVKTATEDPVKENNQARLQDKVTRSADLSIAKKGAPDPVIAGVQLLYQIVAKNAGPSDAANVILETAPSPKLQGQEYSIDEGATWNTWEGSVILGVIPAGDSRKALIRGQVAPSGTGRIVAGAKVRSDSTDPDVSNNASGDVVTNIIQVSDVAIAPAELPESAVAGENVLFSLSVSNGGPSDAASVVIRRDPSPQFTDVEFLNEAKGEWQRWESPLDLGTFQAGGSQRIKLRGKVSPLAKTTLTNAAHVETATSDPDFSNNTTNITVGKVETLADLTISLTDSPDPVVAGSQLTFTATVRNRGPSEAQDVVLSNELPKELQKTRYSIDGGTTWNLWQGSLNLETINAGSEKQVLILGWTDPSSSGLIMNTAGVESKTQDPNPADNKAGLVRTEVLTRSDLSVVQRGQPDTATVGESLTYRIAVQNAGPSDVRNAKLEFLFPEHLRNPRMSTDQGESWKPVESVVDLETFPARSTREIWVRFDLDSSVTNTISSKFRVGSESEDSDVANNMVELIAQTRASADLVIGVTDLPQGPPAGTNLTYGLLLRNEGPSDALDVMLAAGLSDVPMTNVRFSSDDGKSWESLGDSIQLGSIGAGGDKKVMIRGDLKASAKGALRPVFIISSGKTDDPDKSNDRVEPESAIATQADVAVEFIGSTAPALAGTPYGFKLRVRNAGPSDAEDVVLSSGLPELFSEPMVRSDEGREWKPWSGNVHLGALPAGDDRELEFRCSVAPSATGSVVLTAELKSSTEDPAPANNRAEASTGNFGTRADLSIVQGADGPDVIRAAPDPVTAGETLTYTLKVKNDGPSDAVNVSLELNLPEGLGNANVSLDQGANWEAAGSKVQLASIMAGSTKTVLIRCDVDPSTTDSLESGFRLEAQTEDPDAGNNVAERTSGVQVSADLALASSDAPTNTVGGSPIVYVLAVRNNGPSNSGESALIAQPFEDIQNVRFSINGGETWELWKDTLNIGAVKAGEAKKIWIRGDVSPAARGSLQTTFEVSAGKTPDSEKGNDRLQLVSIIENRADLALNMKSSHDSVVAGTPLTYSLVIGNNGPSDAEKVELIDRFTDGRIEASFRTEQETEWKPWVGTLTFEAIPTKATRKVEIRCVLTPSATGSLTNAAELKSATEDPAPVNNRTEILRTVINSEADLFIGQTVKSPENLVAGNELLRLITVTNEGPSDARGVVIGDTISVGMLRPEYALNDEKEWSPWPGSLSLDVLSANGTKQIRVRALVGSGAKGPLTHHVTVKSETRDPDTTNNASKVLSEIAVSADLELIISDPPSEVVAGEVVTHTVNVKNYGPSDAVNCRIEAEFPPDLIEPKISMDNAKSWKEWEGPFTIGSIGAGGFGALKIQGKIAPSASNKLVYSIRTVSSTVDPLPHNNEFTTTATVRKQSDFALSGSANPDVLAGDTILYKIHVLNNGPSDADEVRLTHLLPGGVKEIEYSLDGGGRWEPVDRKGIEIRDIRAGTGKDLLIQGKVDSSLAGGIRATASLESKIPDPNSGNNQAIDIVSEVRSEADLSLTLSDLPKAVLAGGAVEYSAKIENRGPSDATDAVLKETVQEGSFKQREWARDGSMWEPWNGQLAMGTLKAHESRVLRFRCMSDSSIREGLQPLEVALSSATSDPRSEDNGFKGAVKVERLADLSITIRTPLELVTVGQAIEYILDVENEGPSGAINVVIEDYLPEAVENPEFALEGQEAWRVLEAPLRLGEVASGDSKQLRIRGRVSLSAEGTIESRAAVKADTPDPISENNTSFRNTAVKTLADLSITMAESPDPVTAGAGINFIISAFNAGPSKANNVRLTAALDPMIGQLMSSTDGGANWSKLSSVIELGALSAGNSRHVLVQGAVDRGATGMVSHTASVTSDTQDPQSENNETEKITTAIDAQADLTVAMAVTPRKVDAGKTVMYTITAANEGPSDAMEVVVEVLMPPPIRDGKASLDGGATWSMLTDEVEVGALRAGTSKLVLILGTVQPGPASGVLNNEARVRSATADPVVENNATGAVNIEVSGTR
ncbi:MAG: DUF11 domain-containing protein [Deltaproteobacteria bacterium]|nr:DUF11 domain-containing protein [Deltaproteobacteria bacterium]